MFWSHYGGHHGSHPLLFEYCLFQCSTDLFEPLHKVIDHDFQTKPRGRSAHCRSGQWQPQSLFHGGCLRCSVCVKVWCDALRWPAFPIVLKDYLASSEKVNKVQCISLKGPFERIVLRPILESRWNIYSLRCLSGCSLLLKGDGQWRVSFEADVLVPARVKNANHAHHLCLFVRDICKMRPPMATAPCSPWVWWSWPQMRMDDAIRSMSFKDRIKISWIIQTMQFCVKGSAFFQVLIQKYSKSSEMDKVRDRHPAPTQIRWLAIFFRNLNGNRQGPLLEAWPHWSRGWLQLVAGLKLVERCRKHLKQQTCFGTPNRYPCDSEVLCSLNSWIVWAFQTCFHQGHWHHQEVHQGVGDVSWSKWAITNSSTKTNQNVFVRDAILAIISPDQLIIFCV